MKAEHFRKEFYLDTATEDERKYRRLFENASEGMCIVGLDGKLMEVNRRMCELFGYTRREMEAMTVNDLSHPEDLNISPQFIEESLAGEKGNASFLKRYIHRKGQTITAKVSTTLVRDEDGAPHYFISHVQDVTAEKRLEKERRKFEKQLRQSQKLEAIGTLAGGIAHDFNNILSSVIGFTELAIIDTPTGSGLRDNLMEVLKAGSRAKDLVQQILMFSREEELEQKPVQLNLIVEEAFGLLRSSIPTTIEMNCRVESDSLVMGDASQFHQVLMNLCTNAAHAMNQTGGHLNIHIKDVDLDAGFVVTHPELSPGPHILLTVADTGPGIPKSIMEEIFLPFFTTKEKGEGTGLGLSVVHGIVRGCGGGIYAYSEPGKGTAFNVYLPAVKKTVSAPETLPTAIPGGSENILFVDDEPMLTKLGKQILQSLGYSVTTCTNSVEALEQFKNNHETFDLVITDMTMPKMDGKQLAKGIKNVRQETPVILCTGFNPIFDEWQLQQLGIDAVAGKPFLIRELGETVRRVLDRQAKSDA